MQEIREHCRFLQNVLILEISPKWTWHNFAECHIFGNFTSGNIAEFCRTSHFWKSHFFCPDMSIWSGFLHNLTRIFHNSTSSTYRSVELCLLSLCFRSVYGVLRSLFVFAEFFYLAPCSSMHLPSYRESKPRRDCSLWCLPCIVPYAVIIFEVVLCAVGPLVSKYLSLNTISSTSCLFWLEFTVSEEKPCASGTQGCSLLPSLKFIPFVLQSVILDAKVWQSTTVENLNPTT